MQAKDVVVDFAIDISAAHNSLELYGFSHQNVIFGLTIDKHDSAYTRNIDPSYGVGGDIRADRIAIRFTPGKPESEE